MKKRVLALFLAAATAISMVGCGGSGSGSAGEGMIEKVDLLEIDGFNEAYAPDISSVAQQEGQIDVVIMFDGTETGWEALAKEYERLQGGYVTVKLDTTYIDTVSYTEKLRSEVQGDTEWDIVQGNLIGGELMETYCINMASWITESNAYAGTGNTWKSVLTENAYITDTSGSNSACYILNTENLQTAWFINSVALKAAADKGYVNAEGKAENPVTWDDMMLLCKKMVEAGYTSPLGIALKDDSITSNQFAWLLRVYGDQYYRQEYANVFAIEGDVNYVENEYELDLKATNPEGDADFNISLTRLYNAILDDSISNSAYVGAKSDKFAEFLEQFYKMRDYLRVDAASMSMEEMRNMFTTQSKGKESPQIMLDYAGSGLNFLASEAADYEVDFYDYPKMVGSYVDEEAIVRDVGGNGGYLSCVRQEETQNALNKDFLKFVLSPYGQSVYYEALSKSGSTVKGLTTVQTDLVVVPKTWTEFFATDKIAFNGLVDVNRFISNLIMYIGTAKTDCQTVNKTLWKQYLTGTGSDAITTEDYQKEWHDTLMAAWKKSCKSMGYSENCYLYPGKDTKYSE